MAVNRLSLRARFVYYTTAINTRHLCYNYYYPT